MTRIIINPLLPVNDKILSPAPESSMFVQEGDVLTLRQLAESGP